MKLNLHLPARTLPSRYQKYAFPIRNRWGTGLKTEVRNIAKTLPLYHTPVETDPEVTGRTDDGKVIPINTLGKWLFGAPGYKGNMIIESFEENVSFRLPEIPEAIELIAQAMKILAEK